MTRDDMVAALERAADQNHNSADALVAFNGGVVEVTTQTFLADAALLRALADALREGKDGWYRPESREITMASIMPAYRRYYEPRWIIPEPRLP